MAGAGELRLSKAGVAEGTWLAQVRSGEWNKLENMKFSNFDFRVSILTTDHTDFHGWEMHHAKAAKDAKEQDFRISIFEFRF